MKLELGIGVGRERIALVMPTLGIVVKIPRIRLLRVIKSLVYHIRHRAWRGLLGNLRRSPTAPSLSFQFDLFGGLVSNFSEFWFYLTTRNPFLQPTYLSLLGILNIQRYGEPCPMEAWPMRHEFERLIGQEYMHDGHHFANPRNFSVVLAEATEGDEKCTRLRLRINDYGSPRTQAVVTLWGHKLFRGFRIRQEEGVP
jgi:hypothetical protein